MERLLRVASTTPGTAHRATVPLNTQDTWTTFRNRQARLIVLGLPAVRHERGKRNKVTAQTAGNRTHAMPQNVTAYFLRCELYSARFQGGTGYGAVIPEAGLGTLPMSKDMPEHVTRR